MPEKEWTYLTAAEEVLRDVGEPLHVRDLTNKILERGLIESIGKTPWKTVGAKISVDIRRKREKSRFKRVGPSVYALRESEREEYEAPPSFEPMALVFQAELLDRSNLGRFHGVRKDYQRYASALLHQDPETPSTHFMTRREAETDTNYKQIVSYVMIRHGDSLLRHTRGGEGSALGRYVYDAHSIAFGGHVKWEDRPLWKWHAPDLGYENSVVREVKEEIGITINSWTKEAPIIGIINDDSTDLGTKHFAFVHLLEWPTLELRKTERTIRSPERVKISDLHRDFAGYEYWSKLCIQAFFADQQEVTCHVVPSGMGTEAEFSLKDQADFILVVGYIGSGKTMACSILEEFGYRLIRGSSVLKSLLGYGLEDNVPRKVLQEKGLAFISEPDGHDRLAQGILERMRMHPSRRYVLDGLRYWESLEALRARLVTPVTVMYIESPVDNLLDYHRRREESSISYEDFLNIVYHPVELDICRFYNTADVTVYNHGALDFYAQTLFRYFHSELE
jgi:predicted NUDIX family phosphoesterase